MRLTLTMSTKDTCLIVKNENEKIIHHYISCVRKTDNVKGVYDLIEKKFTPLVVNEYLDNEHYIVDNESYIDTEVKYYGN